MICLSSFSIDSGKLAKIIQSKYEIYVLIFSENSKIPRNSWPKNKARTPAIMPSGAPQKFFKINLFIRYAIAKQIEKKTRSISILLPQFFS